MALADPLHGHEKLIFWDHRDDGTIYLERVTVNENEAVEMMAGDLDVGTDEVGVEPIWMRWATETDEPSYDALELPCWAVCAETDSDSIPFWRVAPPKSGGGKANG